MLPDVVGAPARHGRVPLVAHLRRLGDAPALRGTGIPGETLSYAALADRVERAATAYAGSRRLTRRSAGPKAAPGSAPD